MSMKLLRVQTHWDAEDAYAVLEVLDALREEIITQYGDEIIEMLRAASTDHTTDQLTLPFIDLPPF